MKPKSLKVLLIHSTPEQLQKVMSIHSIKGVVLTTKMGELISERATSGYDITVVSNENGFTIIKEGLKKTEHDLIDVVKKIILTLRLKELKGE